MAETTVKNVPFKQRTKQKVRRTYDVTIWAYSVLTMLFGGIYILVLHATTEVEKFLGLSLVLLAVYKMVKEKR